MVLFIQRYELDLTLQFSQENQRSMMTSMIIGSFNNIETYKDLKQVRVLRF